MELDVKRFTGMKVNEGIAMIIGKPHGYSWKNIEERRKKAKLDAAKVSARERRISRGSVSDSEEEDVAVIGPAIRKSRYLFLEIFHTFCFVFLKYMSSEYALRMSETEVCVGSCKMVKANLPRNKKHLPGYKV